MLRTMLITSLMPRAFWGGTVLLELGASLWWYSQAQIHVSLSRIVVEFCEQPLEHVYVRWYYV